MTLAVILIPFLVALLVIFSPRGMAYALALLSTFATFICSLFLAGSSPLSRQWIPGFGSYFELSSVGAASVLIPVAALVMIPTVYYAGYKVVERTSGLLALLLAMQAGLNGIFLAKDLLLFYVFWEATLIPSVLMLGIWGREERRQAALKYLIYAVAGSFLMLISILAIKPLSGAVSYRITDLMATTPNLATATQIWLFIGMAIGMAVKLPLWPLHGWLIDFNEQNHVSGVADVAGTLYKVGGFGFFAWALPLLPAAAQSIGLLFLILSAITALYAALIATTQTHLKRFLAYTSLAHMGIVGVGVFGLNIAGLNGAVFLLAAQMLSTGGLFLISGMLYERKGDFDMTAYGGLSKSAPALAALSLFILFTSIGVPGLANFPGEFMSLMGAFQTYPWVAALATLSVIAAGVYGVNAYQRLFQGEQKEAIREIRSAEFLVLVPLLAGILWLGLFPSQSFEHIDEQSSLLTQQLEQVDATPVKLAGGN
ncbi:MAG: NADH-quinone oxidoreductase subunit M [Trueperaceae bacterium]|nr:NADH-quinone oxidoreductase subunit M [Trueperaceae bacterium]